jgi:sulfite reductase (NADPH) hemoprotein beta-component
MGIPWYRRQVEELIGFKLDPPEPSHDYGARMLHHGWQTQPSNGLWAYGAFIENGRLSGPLKSMVSHLMKSFPIQVSITPNQDLLFSDIPPGAREDFEGQMRGFGYGTRDGIPHSTLRKLSGACVGRDTCRLTYTDSERFEPELMGRLEAMGWGEMKESIGITGCERQCFRPGTKTIGLVGSGLNRYLFKLMGTEDGRHQGVPLTSEDGTLTYLHSVPRAKVAVVIDALFRFYRDNKSEGEGMGYFHRRVGASSILEFLAADPATSDLVKSPKRGNAPFDNPEGPEMGMSLQ